MLGPQVAGALVAVFEAAARDARVGWMPDAGTTGRALIELAVEITHVEDPRDDDT